MCQKNMVNGLFLGDLTMGEKWTLLGQPMRRASASFPRDVQKELYPHIGGVPCGVLSSSQQLNRYQTHTRSVVICDSAPE